MIVTDKFVYIHLPKTGGTFVTDSLIKLHRARWSALHHLRYAAFGKIAYQSPWGKLMLIGPKHGTCEHIPPSFRNRTLMSTIRNPLDYYVSQYAFGWWKRNEFQRHYRNIPDFTRQFPSFPNLSFPDYLRLTTQAFNPENHRVFEAPTAIGWFTSTFIRYFFRKPETILARVDSNYLSHADFRHDMYPVRFISTHMLNHQLYAFLRDQTYPEDATEFILRRKKVLPQGKGRTQNQDWQKYYTPELKSLILEKDRLLFQLFPIYEELANQG